MHLNGDAEPVIPTLLPFTHLRVLARIEETRMRIQRLQHALDAAVDQAVGGHFLHVLAIDGRERRGEDPILLRDFILPCQDAAVEAADKRREHHRQQRNREKSGITHN